MNLLSYLTKQLKNVLTEIHAGKQTLPDDIYAILQKTNFEDGSCLILTDAEPTCCTKALRIPSFLPVFESCLTLPGLFNRLNQKLQDYPGLWMYVHALSADLSSTSLRREHQKYRAVGCSLF